MNKHELMTATEQQEQEWSILHQRVTAVSDGFGRKDALGDGDYWLVDDNWGWWEHQVEIQNLRFLQPDVIEALQRVLLGRPDWCVTVAVPKAEGRPGMGVIVYDDEIVDDLRREFLPAEFQDLRYAGNVTYGTSKS